MKKKTVYAVVTICLIIGFPLIIISLFSLPDLGSGFLLNDGYNQCITVDLNEKARHGEIVFKAKIEKPEMYEFKLQSDVLSDKEVKLVSSDKLIGKTSKDIRLIQGKSNSTTPAIIFEKGSFKIQVTNEKAKGKLLIYYREKILTEKNLARFRKLEKGYLSNPPQGYKKVFYAALSEVKADNMEVYTFHLDKPKTVSFSAYTNSKKGSMLLTFNGGRKNSHYYNYLLIDKSSYLNDALSLYLEKGSYTINLTAKDSDGELYLFIKDE